MQESKLLARKVNHHNDLERCSDAPAHYPGNHPHPQARHFNQYPAARGIRNRSPESQRQDYRSPFVDNPYTHKPITKDNIRILTMFANQAGLAIENSKLYEQTLIKSHTDSLTSLWNHGYFQSRLQEEVSLAQKNKQNLSIIMADLDNFKVYNDTLGHQEGDQILIQIAKILNSAGEKTRYDLPLRGREFAILLLQTNKQEARVVAEK